MKLREILGFSSNKIQVESVEDHISRKTFGGRYIFTSPTWEISLSLVQVRMMYEWCRQIIHKDDS